MGSAGRACQKNRQLGKGGIASIHVAKVNLPFAFPRNVSWTSRRSHFRYRSPPTSFTARVSRVPRRGPIRGPFMRWSTRRRVAGLCPTEKAEFNSISSFGVSVCWATPRVFVSWQLPAPLKEGLIRTIACFAKLLRDNSVRDSLVAELSKSAETIER